MMAMALACDPELVIADEPTTALDVIVQAQILALLTDLVRERGISLIMITHDLSVLAQTCDRIAVMYAGRLVETGPSLEVIGAPLHPYTRALAGAFPTLGDPRSRLAPGGLAGDPPDLREIFEGCPFAPRCPLVEDRCRHGAIPLVPQADRAAACVLVPGAEMVGPRG
jgi:peptide/nickel transport system ATP-binding protein